MLFLRKHETLAFVVSSCLGLWLTLIMPVFAQEAYYWSYAQRPDLSYFDHPPMVAWLIWVGTHVFGDGALGLRLGTWLCGCLLTWVGLSWLRGLGADTRVCIAFLVCSIGVPALGIVHFLTNPDPALAGFWAVSMFALWRARGGGLGWWLLAGFAAGCALLSKYTAAFLAVGGAIVLMLDPHMRRRWRRPGLYLAVLLAAVTFLPVIAWNVGNDFESFRFQTGRFEKSQLGVRWLFQFVGGQLLVFHPVFALLTPAVVLWLWRRARQGDSRSLWLLAFGVPLPLFFAIASLFIQVKINWLVPAYLPLLAGILLWWREREGAWLTRWPRTVAMAKGSVVTTALLVPLLAPLVWLLPQTGGTSWTGWDDIAQRAKFWRDDLDRQDGVAGNVFFFAPNYRDAAQLGRQLKLSDATQQPAGCPQRETVLAQNTFGDSALQFDHWDAPSRHVCEDAIFVLLRPEREAAQAARLAAHFHSVSKVERVHVARLGILLAEADIYQCRGYRGPHPSRGNSKR